VLRLTLARNLSLEQFGLFYAVFSFIAFFNLFRGLGLDQALTKLILKHNSKKDHKSLIVSITTIFVSKLVASVVISLILISVSTILAKYYFKVDVAASMIIILLIGFIVAVFLDIFSTIFICYNKMLAYSMIEFFRNFLVLTLTMLLFGFGWSIYSPSFSYTLAPIMITLFFLIYYRRHIPEYIHIKKNFNIRILKNSLRYSIPIFLGSFAGLFITYTDVLVLTYFRPLSEIGWYSAAVPIANIISFFSVALTTVAFPIVTELYVSRNIKKIKEGLELFYKNIFFVLLPPTILIVIFNKFILSLMFGEQYVAASPVLIIMSIGFLFYSLANINIVFLNGINKPKSATKIIFLVGIVNVLMNFILIPSIGMVGAALSVTITFMFFFIVSLLQLKKNIRFKIPIKTWLMNFFVGTIYLSVLIFLQEYLIMPLIQKIVLMLLISTFFYLLISKVLRVESISLLKDFLIAKKN
jgi:O-antigen/teichoic acid export membrane protein